MIRDKRVLIAGGTGTAGRAYARAMAARGWAVSATARDRAGEDGVREMGAEPVRVDLSDSAATAAAMEGIDVVVVAVLGRGADAAAQEETVTRTVIDAAAGASVERVVYTSVHTADRPTGVAHFEVKGRLERYLADAAVRATVLRPCTFMDALTAPWILEGLLSRGVLTSPIAIDAPISYIATADLAAVAIAALDDPLVADSTIELGGPKPVTYHELLPTYSELIGQEVRYEQLPLEVVESQFGADMAAMIRLFNDHGFTAAPDRTVERLGIELTSAEDFLRDALTAPTAAGPQSA